MGIRESLLNTITSVGSSDFVRIVTSAGVSSKATVQNLFKSFETGLGAKSSLTTSDYIRVVGSDDVSYKQALNDVLSAGGAYQSHYASNNSNCNDFTTIGTYYGTFSSNTPLGATSSASGYLFVFPHPQTTSYVKQFFSRFNYDEVYMRTCNNGTWSSWVLMPTRAEVDALNSKTGNYVSGISSDYGTVSSNSTIRIGNVVLVSLRLTLTSNAAAYSQIIKGIPISDTTDVGTIFSIKGKKISGSAINGDVGLSLYRNSSTLSNWIALSNGDVVDISGCYLAKE